MSTRKPYTPDDLRELSKQSGPQWAGEVRAALLFAADVIEAANAILSQRQPTSPKGSDAIVKKA